MKIPKIIHQIWIGQKPRPTALLDTCKNLNPTWEYRLWTEDNLPKDFINKAHIEQIAKYQTNYPEASQSNIMRYELLYRYGGFFVDADSEFINPLDDFLTENDSFTCYSSETYRGDSLANGYLACTKRNELMKILIQEIKNKASVIKQLSYIETGPVFLTKMVKKHKYNKLKIYPSYYFIPRFYSPDSQYYQGPGKVYCIQHWGSTHEPYIKGHLIAIQCNVKGKGLYENGKVEEAKAQFRMAIQINPGFVEPYNNLAVLYWREKQLNEALSELREAFKLDPNNIDANVNFGLICLEMGRKDVALHTFENYLQRNPDSEEMKKLLSEIRS